jgi:8-oxo-dGTP pyrophosphatase MutT (NUDIX family)
MLAAYPVNPDWTHAGGLVYRTHAGRHELLLVRARPKPHDWVFPKGHIERGEAPHDCARREIREEAGVEAEPVSFLGEDRFTNPKGADVHVALFLMKYVRDVPAEERRGRRWCSIPEALALIRFESGRSSIRAAESHLTGLRGST